jgi:cold shock CspA family protein
LICSRTNSFGNAGVVKRQDVFSMAVQAAGVRGLNEGQRVQFEVESDKYGSRP